MKISKSVIRKDSMQEHCHSLPNGQETQGMLTKPSHSLQFKMHSHLYENDEGETLETSITVEGPGHTHESEYGETSGPHEMPAKESFGPRNDSMMRIGSEWHIRGVNGVTLSKGKTPEEAARRYDSEDSYDEAFARKAINCMDDAKWEAAKAHSQANFGEHKWPYVQHICKILGGA